MSRSPRVFRVGAIFTRSRGAAKLIRRSMLCLAVNCWTHDREIRPNAPASQRLQPCRSPLDRRHAHGGSRQPAIGF